jgi:fibronectin-binding autotransporter adhesin
MNSNDLRPLHAAIKASLRAARSVNSKRAASSVALLALSASAWVPQAMAATYTASNETELRNAITAANADADPNATITLTSSFTVSNTAFPVPTKPMTIDTQGFVLSGVATGSGTINFSGSSIPSGTLTFAGTYAGGSPTNVANAGFGLQLNGTGQVINNGAFTGGNAVSTGQAGGIGVSVANVLTLVNNGTISGGTAIAYAGNATTAGPGVTLNNGGSLINNGTVQGGNSQGAGAGAGLYMNGLAGSPTVTNYGTIRGGSDLTGAVAGNEAIQGHGPATSIINYGLLEGGNGAAAIANDGTGWRVSIVNSGTIRGGVGQSAAIRLSAGSDRLTLELQHGSVIEGNVVANAAGSNDILRLGGAADSTFDVSAIGATAQYQNFDSFQKIGTSTWTLTGTGTVATPWQIQQGTLQLGDGGTSGSIIGDVTNDGTLAFNRSDTLTVGGLISGTGSVNQIGTGTTILTGNNTYVGGTTISAGTLQIGTGGTSGSIIGDVTNDGTHSTAATCSPLRAPSAARDR